MMKKPFGLSVRTVLLNNEGKCLLLKRSNKNKTNIDKWEFPGGKIEPGEKLDEALSREVLEETNLGISIIRVVGVVQTELPNINVIQLIFETKLETGDVYLSIEHEDYIWIKPQELHTYDLLEEFKSFAQQYSKTH
jgi:8-oxo-dGTP diphosphatase